MVHLSSPYVPEYLAFREVEFLVNCVSRLLKSKPELVPQVILVDGNGMLHPRGLISHYIKWMDHVSFGGRRSMYWLISRSTVDQHIGRCVGRESTESWKRVRRYIG